MFLFKQLCYRQ